MTTHPLFLSELDHHRLAELLTIARRKRLEDPAHLNGLAHELNAATVVPCDEMPDDVVTLHSRVKLEFPAAGSFRTCRIVLPSELGVSANEVSVLSPLGTALIGPREGDDIEYMVRGRPQSVRVVRILSQPRADKSRKAAATAMR
jgi:regulator of nucleoside diphosphate kinase